jgi:hypothetical protein
LVTDYWLLASREWLDDLAGTMTTPKIFVSIKQLTIWIIINAIGYWHDFAIGPAHPKPGPVGNQTF